MEQIVGLILLIVLVYLVLGLIFSIFFLWRGINKVDEGAEGSSFVFKLLIIPGMLVFWTFFLYKWIKSK